MAFLGIRCMNMTQMGIFQVTLEVIKAINDHYVKVRCSSTDVMQLKTYKLMTRKTLLFAP